MVEVVVTASGLLFDNDGTLVDSTPSVDRSWRKYAARYGVPNAELVQIAHGTRAQDIIKKMTPDVDVDEALKVIEDIEVADTDDVVVLPGTKALLESLPLNRWIVVTSATHRLYVVRFGVVGLPMPAAAVTAESVVMGKPDPEPYRKGAELLGFATGECIVFEDAPSGVMAGKAAGCRVVGLVTTHKAEQLREAGADWVVESLEGVTAEMVDGMVRLKLVEVVS